MCGIAGIKRMGDYPIFKSQVDFLLSSIERRGTDATGVALMDNLGEIRVHKNDEPAWRFIGSPEYEEFLSTNLTSNTTCVLLHTRAATKGAPSQYENNHPIENGLAAVVHNGVINNDDLLFDELKLTRSAETDSDIIRAIVDAHGLTHKAVRELNKLRGTCASVIVSPDRPDEVLFLRSGNPLVIAATPQNHIIWASEKQAIHAACRPWKKTWGIYMQANKPEVLFCAMPEDSAWLFGPEGLVWHQRFFTIGTYTTGQSGAQCTGWSRKRTRSSITKSSVIPFLLPAASKEVIHLEEGSFVECSSCTGMAEVTPGVEEAEVDFGTVQCSGCARLSSSHFGGLGIVQ